MLPSDFFSKKCYQSMDAIMCVMMNFIQWKLRHQTTTKKCLEAYLEECSSLDRTTYFATPPMEEFVQQSLSGHNVLSWKSPRQGPFSENNRARALFFPADQHNSTSRDKFLSDNKSFNRQQRTPNCKLQLRPNDQNSKVPTLIILHALMSASDRGYRRIAAQMNQRGWNVLFPHLPFHYSRRPNGYSNGALAVTADLVRNGETLRQAVKEIRQLMDWSRVQGSERIGILGTSYGGWIASLVLSLEKVDFSLLLQPITEIDYATFKSPLSRIMARLLTAQGITSKHLNRHAHLTSPTHGIPQCAPERLIVIGGSYDTIALPKHLQHCCHYWKSSLYDEVEQGHFGHRAMRRAMEHIDFLISRE
ncbi:MAG: hypothetical protein A3F67_05660 [Verrucomicrobia bacterium RIFCSPHIGHO2_12_FULL_41_10]|nr:MAG: hypothetical protein A3F67_05660 [Verrucomicrobia bacterium RIFCSPHIGHO2_12_FULL_41_10]